MREMAAWWANGGAAQLQMLVQHLSGAPRTPTPPPIPPIPPTLVEDEPPPAAPQDPEAAAAAAAAAGTAEGGGAPLNEPGYGPKGAGKNARRASPYEGGSSAELPATGSTLT